MSVTTRPAAKNILIIKPSAIGDVVHTLPLWNLLRKSYPDAAISWLVAPACQGIIEGLPGLRLYRFERKAWAGWWRSWSSARQLRSFQRSLREANFDLVIDAQGLFRSAWFAWQTRAPMRVGFANAREMAWMFYTHRVEVGSAEQHAIERYRKLLAAIGCTDSPVEFPFPVQDADRASAGAMVDGLGEYAVLCPSTNWPTKQWPAEKFAQLIPLLRTEFGLSAIAVGGPTDVALGEELAGARNLCGKTSLMQLVALMERAKLVITNDSGPMHIAAALGKPLVAAFGPTNPIRTGPYGKPESVVRLDVPCMPCYSRSCPLQHHDCMGQLSVEAIMSAARRQLAAP